MKSIQVVVGENASTKTMWFEKTLFVVITLAITFFSTDSFASGYSKGHDGSLGKALISAGGYAASHNAYRHYKKPYGYNYRYRSRNRYYYPRYRSRYYGRPYYGKRYYNKFYHGHSYRYRRHY